MRWGGECGEAREREGRRSHRAHMLAGRARGDKDSVQRGHKEMLIIAPDNLLWVHFMKRYIV